MGPDKKYHSFSLTKWWQKTKREKELVQLIAVCTFLLAACVLIASFHVRRILTAFEQSSYDFIINRSELSSRFFSENFERRGTLVSAEAQVLSQGRNFNKERICSGLKVLEETGEFSYAIYVSNRGIKYYSSGSTNSTMLRPYAEAIDENKANTAYRNFDSKLTDDEISFGSPVEKNGIVQGYIIGVTSAGSMFETNPNAATMIAERYLTDSKGNIVAYTKNDQVYDGTGRNIFDILTHDSIDDYAASQVREDVLNEINSEEITNRPISVNGRTGYALYKQLAGTSGWDLFYIVYSDDVRATIQPILIESFGVMLIVIVIMAVMSSFVFHYIRNEQKKVYDLAYVDDLTRAPNENAFKEKATELLLENPEVPYMLTCFDIMNFRYINEGYGHLKADMLLRDIAVALRESYSYNETFGRLSADRFVGLCVDDERGVARKEFIDERLAKATEEIGMKYPIKFKTGIYYIRDKKEPISDMIDKANLARKSVVTSQRNLDAEYREQLMEETRQQERIESRMHEALENGEFRPYLQPKWNMTTDTIYGSEALIRWVDGTGNIIPPNEFIP
ncbi:MAG: diguanylate cyclase, partial [Lachnospiraceae bacterium]|nr:diguanylate cyclase [Lachnospiraceae bacterium]